MAVTVRVIKKYYKDGVLIGYNIMDTNGNSIDIKKEALKSAVMSGKIAVENMTLTSDGRLIGRAGKKKTNNRVVPPVARPVVNVVEVYTNGRNIPGVLVSTSEKMDSIAGLNPGCTFDTGLDYIANVKNNWYNNVKLENGKVTGEFKKKSFKNIRNKLVELVVNNTVEPGIAVTKSEDRLKNKTYVIEIDTHCAPTQISQAILILIMDTLYSNSIIPLCIYDDIVIEVKCITGINDVRKALKNTFKTVDKTKSTKTKTDKAKK